jgi:hypothetical protein
VRFPSAASSAAVATLFCAAAIFSGAACRQDVAPLRNNLKVLQGEARNRAEAAFRESVRKMTPADIAALDAAWSANPEDMEALKKLLLVYAPDFTGKDSRDQQQVVAARRRYILWLIEHHPDHDLAGDWNARIYSTSRDPLPDPDGYARAKSLWLEKVAPADTTSPILSNAAYFFETSDKPLAAEMLRRAQARDPRDDWSERLGRLYALMLLGTETAMPFNVPRYLNLAAARAWSAEAQQRLSATTDARMLATAGEYLFFFGQSLKHRRDRVEITFDPVAPGVTYLQRAVAIDPALHHANRLLQAHALDPEFTRLHAALEGVPPEKVPNALSSLSATDRLLLLPDLADGAFAQALHFHYVENDPRRALPAWVRSKEYAEAALDLSDDFKDHPYYGAVVYRANVTLGAHAFHEGDRARAVEFLGEAAKAPPSPGLSASGYMLEQRLANYLLKYGERESVARFYERSADLRPADRQQLLEAAADIRAGINPASYQRMMAREAFAGGAR